MKNPTMTFPRSSNGRIRNKVTKLWVPGWTSGPSRIPSRMTPSAPPPGRPRCAPRLCSLQQSAKPRKPAYRQHAAKLSLPARYLKPLEPVMNFPADGAGSQFSSVQGARSDEYGLSSSNERRRNEVNWPQPSGFHPRESS